MIDSMKVLLVAVGTRGDVQPMLALALRLRARGHAIQFCAPPNFEPWVGSHGLAFRGLGRDFQAFLHQIGNRVHRGMAAVRHDIRQQFAELEDLVPRADIMLGASLTCAGISLGRKYGVPYAYVAYTPSLLPSADHPAPTCPYFHLPRFINRFTWWTNELFWNLLFRRPLNHERHRLGLPPVRNVFRHIVEDASVILASEPLLGRPPSTASGVTQTGAWFLPETDRLDPDLEAFLAQGPPPVYIGFGSMTDRRSARTSVLVVQAVRAAGLRAIVGRGWAGLDGAAASPDLHFVGSVPHGQLFPRVAAVVHHGGAGTTSAAARAGVPQLVVPHLLDQFYFAHQVHGLGLGPKAIWRSRLTARRLADALRACTGDSLLRARAAAFAARMTLDGLDQAAAAVETLATRGRLERPPEAPQHHPAPGAAA